MDLLMQYSDEEEVPEPSAPSAPSASSTAVVPRVMDIAVTGAPEVDAFGSHHEPIDITKTLVTNPKMDRIFNPLQGPLLPGQGALHQKLSKHKMGAVETCHINEFHFDDQYHSFLNYGRANAPGANGTVHATHGVEDEQAGASVFDAGKKIDSRKRLKMGDPADMEGYLGPWGGYEGEKEKREAAEKEAKDRKTEMMLEKEEEEMIKAESKEEEVNKERVTSVFHGRKENDYQDRSWMHAKTSEQRKLAGDSLKNFIPKKWVHSFEGHTMGVQAVRFFPTTGHLLLSASMDSKIKMWDYYNQRKCLRTYMGHDQAVRDIQFTTGGTKFYSCSYDKNINLWDTETGQVITTFTNKKTPFCLAVHPDIDKQNRVLAGCSNKKAVEFDSDTGGIVQEYDEHLGTVNSITFVDEARRLVTTSDDKKIFIWEYGIPVVTKHIADPAFHSVPTITVHPEGRYFCGQSMNNKIITYEALGRFKYQPQKVFRGHMCTGYSIQVNFSPDGRFIMSGDNDGKLWFWDFNKGKNYRTIKAHDGVCIGCVWHPVQVSRVVTCGWDALIKLWD